MKIKRLPVYGTGEHGTAEMAIFCKENQVPSVITVMAKFGEYSYTEGCDEDQHGSVYVVFLVDSRDIKRFRLEFKTYKQQQQQQR